MKDEYTGWEFITITLDRFMQFSDSAESYVFFGIDTELVDNTFFERINSAIENLNGGDVEALEGGYYLKDFYTKGILAYVSSEDIREALNKCLDQILEFKHRTDRVMKTSTQVLPGSSTIYL